MRSLVIFIITLFCVNGLAAKAKGSSIKAVSYYGEGLCIYPAFKCIKVKRRQNWVKLFPDPYQRDLVQRLNRTYNHLWAGKVIAVPKALSSTTLFDLSPFSLKISPTTDKQIIVDQEKLAWAAYNEQGQLLKWGPISSGRDKCSDSDNSCLTITGIFKLFDKRDKDCISNAFPAGRGGAQMPYCMFFHKGYAIHGSADIPGHRASHGCVRIFTEDAKWLNEEFISLSDKENEYSGTLIIIRPLARVKWQEGVAIPQAED